MLRNSVRRSTTITIRNISQRTHRPPTAKTSPEPPPLKLDERIWANMQAKEKTIRASDGLAKHEIGPDHRAKMVSWMVEVLSELGSATQTLFLAVRYMDLFFRRHKPTLPLNQLHIIGATAMFLASKFEDVLPIPLQTLQEEVVHKTFSSSQLKKYELKMLRTLDFDINVPTTIDFLGYICEKLGVARIVCHCAVNVAVIAQVNYHGLRYSPSKQAVACLIIAATSLNQMRLVSQVVGLGGYSQTELLPALDCLYNAVVQFPKRYPKLTAPLQCLRCTIVGKTPGPLFKFDDEDLEKAQKQFLEPFK